MSGDSYTISTVCPREFCDDLRVGCEPGVLHGQDFPDGISSGAENQHQPGHLEIANGASGIYIAGLAFRTVTPLPSGVNPIVIMCDNACTSLAQAPSHIWFDRVQIFAPDPPAATGPLTQRGISMPSRGNPAMPDGQERI